MQSTISGGNRCEECGCDLSISNNWRYCIDCKNK